MAEFAGVSVWLSTASAKQQRLLATSNGTLYTMGGNVACLPQVVAEIIIIIIIIGCGGKFLPPYTYYLPKMVLEILVCSIYTF